MNQELKVLAFMIPFYFVPKFEFEFEFISGFSHIPAHLFAHWLPVFIIGSAQRHQQMMFWWVLIKRDFWLPFGGGLFYVCLFYVYKPAQGQLVEALHPGGLQLAAASTNFLPQPSNYRG